MSKNDKKALENAGKIIERFGGIRPMAAKISTPVTTVQGWKKRDVIPAGRREQILDAATENNIDLSGVVKGIDASNQNDKKDDAPKAEDVKTEAPKEEVAPKAEAPKEAVQKASDDGDKISSPVLRSQPRSADQETKPHREEASVAPHAGRNDHDSIMAEIKSNSRKTMMASIWITTGLIVLTFLATALLLWPDMRENADKLETQSEKIVKLEGEVNDVNMRTSYMKRIVPDSMQQKMDDLQTQARNIQTTVNQLSDRAEAISSGVLGADAGPLSQRLMVLEKQMAELSGQNNNFGGLIERLRVLEDTIPGQEQLKGSVAELRSMVNNLDGQTTLKQNLADAQNDTDGALGQTLEGVSGNDLKAAAMLIAFSQLRDSFNRNEPFENDLALLQKLAGEDDVELQTALARLAPHADGGVLTAEGLSGEFKGLAGEIVVASLKGEDVSFADKAKARMNNLFKVEKEGELVTGTQTQATVSKAQKMLDEGNIQGAIAELQTLDGDAAEKAQSFIKQAQVSLLGEKVQQMLGENILSKLSGQLPVSGMLNNANGESISLESLNMDEIKHNLEKAVPLQKSQEVIRDEQSGITILPSQSGFKGFSGGQ